LEVVCEISLSAWGYPKNSIYSPSATSGVLAELEIDELLPSSTELFAIVSILSAIAKVG